MLENKLLDFLLIVKLGSEKYYWEGDIYSIRFCEILILWIVKNNVIKF